MKTKNNLLTLTIAATLFAAVMPSITFGMERKRNREQKPEKRITRARFDFASLFNILPTDITRNYIFNEGLSLNDFKSISGTCKEFNQSLPTHWPVLDLSDDAKRLDDQALDDILSRFVVGTSGETHIQSLCLRNCTNLTSNALQIIANRCPHLKTLDLSNCLKITPVEFAAAIPQLPQTIRHLNLRGTEIDGTGLIPLATRCPQLTALDLSWCSNITAAGFVTAIPYFSPTLTHINVNNTKLDDAGLAILVTRKPHLVELNLWGCRNITTAGLTAVIPHLSPALNNLDLCGTKINDAGLLALASRCQRLVKLDLLDCNNITAMGFVAALKNIAPSLTHLDLEETNIDDAGLAVLAKRCPHLTCVDLTSCRKITRDGFAAMPSSIIELNLFGTGIDDDGIAALTTRCTNLAKLYLGCCNNITPTGFSLLPPSLTTLNLFGTTITNAGLIALATRCPHLVELNLRCRNITPTGIKAFHNTRHAAHLQACKVI